MYLIIPEEIQKLKRIYEPYMEGCHLIENAPESAKRAYEDYFAWIIEAQGSDQ